MNDHSDTDDPNGDGEGVWSPDIEKCFHEALALFPPCGRRKHILQEEGGGKMYGRNELIARHIRMRTGKIRTRKQVSSHIQVLARRRARTQSSRSGSGEDLDGFDSSSPASSINTPARAQSAHSQQYAENLLRANQLPPSNHNGNNNNNNNNHHHHHHHHLLHQQALVPLPQPKQILNHYLDLWADRPIATDKIRLVEFSAFIEYRRQQLQSQPAPMSMAVAAAAAATNAHSPAMALASLASVTSAASNGVATAAAAAAVAAASAETHHGLMAPHPHSYINSDPATALSQPQSTPHSISLNHPLLSQFNSHHSHHHQQPQHHQHHHPSQLQSAVAHEAYLQGNSASASQQPLNNNHHHRQQMNQQMGETDYMLYQQQQQSSTPSSSSSIGAGFTRHSYVKIDYRKSICRQSNKLERIDISQIQDKFPKLIGPEGLYNRGPADAFYLVKFWADINTDFEHTIEDQNSYFGFSSSFETLEPFKDITCSTKACSYGSQVVEKVEKIHGALNNSNGRYTYEIDRSPMCEFMAQFIKKLRQLPRASQMNSVLENFSVLQVVSSESTSEILLCLAFVFEIASSEQQNGSQYHVYKLTKD